jgi:hypothetical protein
LVGHPQFAQGLAEELLIKISHRWVFQIDLLASLFPFNAPGIRMILRDSLRLGLRSSFVLEGRDLVAHRFDHVLAVVWLVGLAEI